MLSGAVAMSLGGHRDVERKVIKTFLGNVRENLTSRIFATVFATHEVVPSARAAEGHREFIGS